MLWLIVDRTELKSERQGLQDSRFGMMYGKNSVKVEDMKISIESDEEGHD